MILFLLRRLAWTVLVLFLVMTVSFALAFILPGDPARVIAGPHATAEVVEQIRKQRHLDEPLIVQYENYLKQLVLHGDMGQDRNNQDVREQIFHALPYT